METLKKKRNENNSNTPLTNNVTKIKFNRASEKNYTCDIYTFGQKKYRLVIQANDQTQAYVYAVAEAFENEVSDVRCVVIFTQSPDNIDMDTQPLHVHLMPRSANGAVNE